LQLQQLQGTKLVGAKLYGLQESKYM